MNKLVIFSILLLFCLSYSHQYPLLKDKKFVSKDENVEENVPLSLIRKKRAFDLSSLGLESLGLGDDVVKDLIQKISSLLGDEPDCEVIINNGGGDGGEGVLEDVSATEASADSVTDDSISTQLVTIATKYTADVANTRAVKEAAEPTSVATNDKTTGLIEAPAFVTKGENSGTQVVTGVTDITFSSTEVIQASNPINSQATTEINIQSSPVTQQPTEFPLYPTTRKCRPYLLFC